MCALTLHALFLFLLYSQQLLYHFTSLCSIYISSCTSYTIYKSWFMPHAISYKHNMAPCYLCRITPTHVALATICALRLDGGTPGEGSSFSPLPPRRYRTHAPPPASSPPTRSSRSSSPDTTRLHDYPAYLPDDLRDLCSTPLTPLSLLFSASRTLYSLSRSFL